ncbi:efflux transporter outer membrane subunit [Tenacibaculum piscium]|uniref:RND efflux system, outer membrane lipoprotein CmeC n=1 Tax=Tenacibaculum piscium TaxID=1458515 RepID=A0A2H1YFX6_9FLAO|nr:efflux transporter outer membrane subunit [Tenacibaculum piscium]MBE7629753.1 efflux transporter outer membrane subunit [Tenacibaculum piscium]MBE7671546.1 efflux transporter outer membrane subunit [Tenacibaculum piscium]SOS74330.1 RND efflux system, outer membrane lipoprotein CmeC [Tenacibaculum piscium]
MKFTTKYIYFGKAIIVAIISLTLQSCFVAKDYVRPEIKENDSLYRTDNLATDSISMANISWKNLFTDTYLQQYIEEGLKNNMDVRIAIQQMITAQAYAKQGKAGYLPSINIGANVTHQELSKNSQFGAFLSNTSTDQFDISANLTWEADIWGKIRSNKRATQAVYLQSVAGHQAVKTKLIAGIATTYYNLLALDAQLEITKQTILTRESSLATIKALKDAGQVTQVAVDQNIAQFNNAKALQVDIENAIFKTENTLSILLGKTSTSIQRSSLAVQKNDQNITLGIPTNLLRNRPDVIASEYNLIKSFEQTNMAKSSLYPSLKLTATGGLQSLDLDKLFNINSLFANIVGGLTQPLFNQRKLKTQREVAIAQQEKALLEFKKTLLIAGNEVSNTLFSYQSEIKKFEFRKKEVEALRTAEMNSEELLKSGFANYLDLLTARESALRAELNSIDSKRQQLVIVVNLYQALGGGWK